MIYLSNEPYPQEISVPRSFGVIVPQRNTYLSTADIATDLETDSDTKVLAASQGVVLKEMVDAKADASDVYIKQEVDADLALKADADDVYTKQEVDGALAEKADVSDIPTKTSDLTNDSGFVTGQEVSQTYETKSDATAKETALQDAINRKQDILTFDNVPTNGSSNPVKSDGIYDALATKQPNISDLQTIRSGAAAGATAVQPAELQTALLEKQDRLISGQNIKTINNTSLLGSGNIVIQGGGSDPEAVKFIPQTLTKVQKAQARTNIEAASNEQVSQLEAKLYDFTNLDLTDLKGGYITGPPYSWYGVDANLTKHLVFPCSSGDKFVIKESSNPSKYTFLKTYDTSVAPDLCSGYSLVEMSANEEYDVTAPSDAGYLYIMIKGSSLVDCTPEYVKKAELFTVEIDERLDQAEEDIEELNGKFIDEINIGLTDKKNGYITGPPYNWYGVDAGLTNHIVIPCVSGDVFKVKGNSTRATIYTFLKSYSTSVSPDLCSGATLVTMELGGEVTLTAPSDAHYLYFTTKSNALIDMTPQYVHNIKPYFDELDERMDAIEADSSQLHNGILVEDGKNLAIRNKISGVNLDITDDVVYTNGKVWNSSLQLVTLSVYYNAASIDVSQYVGATLKVFTYGGNTGYQGFKLEDGTPYGVELIPGTDWNKPREFVIPPRAKTFYFSYSTSLGITQKVQFVLSSIADDTIFQAEGGTVGTFNDVKTNQRKLSLFRKMLGSEVVDKFNRLVVSFNGDSILGSQLNGITPSAEYDTGDYPPNMSRVIAARMFFDRYKFAGEDTVFRNLEHIDWTKTGFNVNKGKGDSSTGGFNEFEVWGCASASDVAEITVTGYKYFKLIWSRKNVLTDAWECSVLVSVDGGAYQTPTQAGLTLANTIGTITNHEEMQVYSICELNPAKTYAFKIQPTSNYDKVKFWGCEYWNNPRLDVVVEAFSGSYARAQVLRMTDSWGSDWHTPKIIICDVLAINDNTYYNNGSITISDWMKDNTELLDRAKGRGIPILLIANHIVTATLPALASPYARQTELADIDIPTKMSVYPPESSITGPDGLHLSDYGNAYFFAELQRIFG